MTAAVGIDSVRTSAAPVLTDPPETDPNAPVMPDKAAVAAAGAEAGERSTAAVAAQATEGVEELKIPEWVKDAVFYQIFPERFENGDLGNDPQDTLPWGTAPTRNDFMGGDLQGITQKMGYLSELGVNALYLNPVFESTSNHKYNTTSYERVDQNFGGDRALKQLVDTAHDSGVKVMLDGVLNHVSHQHEWFRDVREKGPESKYWDRFTVHNWPIRYERDERGILRSPDYFSWWGHATLPVLKTDNPEVRDYFLSGENSIVKRWIRDYGIDGWRMDVADDSNFSADYWREARRAIKSENPDAYLLAENWHDASGMLQGDQFDGSMNYKYCREPAVDYFDTVLVTDTWEKGGRTFTMRFYHRPLSAIVDALADAGFLIERIPEPLPDADAFAASPDFYERMTHRPMFLFVRAIKPRWPVTFDPQR